MTDMTAFERRVADGMLHRAGPVRPVDDLAIFEIITATSRTPRWGFTMFSALKLVAASAIVALFGGILLAGILTAPQGDEMVPAAPTDSPNPEATTSPTESSRPFVRSDILPGVELTVEEVEPGAFRVVNDGLRELAPVQDIMFGLDGGLWSETDDGLFRLGGDLVAWPSGTKRSSTDDWRLRGVTPEGVIWTSEWEPPGWGHDVDVIRSYDGERWTVRKADRPDFDLEIAPDGTVYGSWFDPPGEEGRPVVARYGAEGWEQLSEPFADGIGDLLADDGDVWVQHDGGLSAYRDGEWRSVYAQPAWTEHSEGFWVRTAPRLLADEGRASAPDAGTWPLDDYSVMTYARDGWRPLGPDDILRSIDHMEVAVSPEGDLWTWRPEWPEHPEQECDNRLRRYDGERWTRYLSGRCVKEVSFAPDGSPWVLAGVGASGLEEGDPFESHELYVITPEATGTYDGVEPAEVAVQAQTLDILPGVALNVEEVEPGIFHLLDDGVWDLYPSFHLGPNPLGSTIRDSIIAGDDGGIYVLLESGFFRLGDGEIHPWPVEVEERWDVAAVEVAANGTVWVMTGSGFADATRRLHSFDGESWASHEGAIVDDLDTSPSGSVWVLGRDPDTGEKTIRHSADDGASWQRLETPFWLSGNAASLAVVDDSELWLGTMEAPLWHYRDGSWQEHEETGGFSSPLQVNRDGVLWAVQEETLLRFDGSGWQEWSLEELDLRPGGWSPDRYLVAPDGSLWADDIGRGSESEDEADHAAPCPPLARFDGETVQRFLPETCGGQVSLDVAADGSVWVASEHDLYVITPEAAAAE